MSSGSETNRNQGGTGVGGAIVRYMPSKIIEPVLGMLALPFLTRTLGVEGYGIWSVVILTASLMNSAGYGWINNCALRFRSSMDDRLAQFFSNLIFGLFTAAILLGLLLMLGKGSLPDSVKLSVGAYLWWAFADAFFVASANCGEMLFRARHKALKFTLSRIFQGTSRHVVGVSALILSSGSLEIYFIARISCIAMIGLWSWTLNDVWRYLNMRSISRPVLKEFLFFGFPLSIVILMTSLRLVANRFVVLSLAGEEATGLFSVAVNIGGAPLLLFQQVVMLGLYPLAIDAWDKAGDITEIVKDGLRLFFLSSMPALVGLALLSKSALTLIAGPDYTIAWPVLALVSGASFLYGFSQYYSLQFMVSKRTGFMALIGFGATAINILLSVLLVPKFGYKVAAVSTLIANGLLLLSMARWGGVSLRRSFPTRAFFVAISATGLMAVAVGLNEQYSGMTLIPRFISSVLMGVLVFGIVIWRTGSIDQELGKLKGRSPWR